MRETLIQFQSEPILIRTDKNHADPCRGAFFSTANAEPVGCRQRAILVASRL